MGFHWPLAVRVTVAMSGLLLASWPSLLLPAHAGDRGAAQPPRTNSVSPIGSGPATLKQQVRITVETNAPPAVGSTNGVAPKDKSFEWKFSWEGWDGLHSEVSKQTRLKDPLAEIRETIQGTNAYQILHLEQLTMRGKIGAKLALDGAAYVTGKEFQGFDDGVEVRRARIYAQGDCLLVLPVSYQLEIGYIPNEFYIEESYLLFRNLPWIGELKGGQYQAPMGLDVITSSRDLTFMEPAAPLQALAPGVNAGLEVGRPVLDQRATWRFGLFTEGVGQDFGDATRDYGRAILRLTGLPFYQGNPDQPNSTKLLHLGLSANILYSASSSVRYQSRPESHLAPYVIDTGEIAADGALVAGAEAAWVNGPFSVQGEYLHSSVHEANGQVPNFNGCYASASWFLTGESRPYDRSEGKFGRVIPKRNFAFGHGGGAWELAARYSYVNLDGADIRGGRLSMLMAGVNWYLHPNVKWRFDYGFGHVSGYQPGGNLNVFQTRVEIDF
jgi:phosphate-selective porin OprO and OprP